MKHSFSNIIYIFQKDTAKNRGFAMLFTVLIITLILALAIGISDTTYKQAVLSGLAKDSQIAFYQADAAVECGLQYDLTNKAFPYKSSSDTSMANVPNQIPCGNDTAGNLKTLTRDDSVSYPNYYQFFFSPQDNDYDASKPCMILLFNKTADQNGNVTSVVKARGFNICDTSNPRQVERALQVTY
jgi:hypothetical protein